MDPASATKPQLSPPSDQAPSQLRWDNAGAQNHRCSVATASATPDEVILNFGGIVAGSDPRESTAVLMRRIALTPMTAKHLSATLQRLIAELDSRQRLPP